MRVTLEADELAVAALVGGRRHIACLQARSPDKNFPDRDNVRWQTHIDAAAAELAVCKVLGIYWTALSGPQSLGDVGNRIQVRSTRYETGKLVIRARDPDDARFVLVTCRAPEYEIRGWLLGGDAKIARFLASNDRDSRPYWEVPQDALNVFNPSTRQPSAQGSIVNTNGTPPSQERAPRHHGDTRETANGRHPVSGIH